MTITEFLLARIAEDEDTTAFAMNERGGVAVEDVDEFNMLTIGSSRVLAECAAKRAVITEAERVAEENCGCLGHISILRHLAAVYGDHPDYRQEWKP